MTHCASPLPITTYALQEQISTRAALRRLHGGRLRAVRQGQTWLVLEDLGRPGNGTTQPDSAWQCLEGMTLAGNDILALDGIAEAANDDPAALVVRVQLLQRQVRRLERRLRAAETQRAAAQARLEEHRAVEFDLRRSLTALGGAIEQQTRAIEQELSQARWMNQALMAVLERRIAEPEQAPGEASGSVTSPPSRPAPSQLPWYRRLWLRLGGSAHQAAAT